MASLNELAATLAERASKQNNEPFILEMKVLLSIWFSRLRRDALERNRGDRAFFKQYIEVPMVTVNVSELPGFPDMPILRTKYPLPDPVRANGIAFDFVGSPDKISQFKVFLEQHRIVAALNERYTGDKPKALWLNKYLYVVNAEDLDYLGVATVFDDPRLVTTDVCGCSENTCYDDDKDFPVTGDIQQRAIQSILATELRINVDNPPNTVEVDAPAKA